MRTSAWLALALAGAVALATPAQEGGGTVVNLDGYKSKAPAEGKEEALKSKFLRILQFEVASKGEKTKAEVAIFEDAGGSVDANINRWKGLFDPPPGKGRDEMASVRKVKIGDREATVLEIEGTFKPPK